MNKLNTSVVDGMSLELDDLEFLHNSNKETISALAEIVGSKWRVGVVTGNAPTPAPGADFTIIHSEGFIYANGEIFKVLAIDDAHSLSGSSDDRVIAVLDESFSPDGDELNFIGGASHTYIVRNAKLQVIAISDADPVGFLCDFENYTNTLKSAIKTLKDAIIPPIVWIVPTAYGAGFISNPADPLRYTKDVQGWVHLVGSVKVTGGVFGTIGIAGFLLSGYRPLPLQTFRPACSGGHLRVVQFSSNGSIFLGGEDFGNPIFTNEVLCLDGISFYVG